MMLPNPTQIVVALYPETRDLRSPCRFSISANIHTVNVNAQIPKTHMQNHIHVGRPTDLNWQQLQIKSNIRHRRKKKKKRIDGVSYEM